MKKFKITYVVPEATLILEAESTKEAWEKACKILRKTEKNFRVEAVEEN